MGEHKTNETAQLKAEGKISSDLKKVSPITSSHLYLITELAKLGLMALKDDVPLMKQALDAKNEGKAVEPFITKRDFSDITQDVYEHFQTLSGDAGAETIKHFESMCQFVYEQAKNGFKHAVESVSNEPTAGDGDNQSK